MATEYRVLARLIKAENVPRYVTDQHRGRRSQTPKGAYISITLETEDREGYQYHRPIEATIPVPDDPFIPDVEILLREALVVLRKAYLQESLYDRKGLLLGTLDLMAGTASVVGDQVRKEDQYREVRSHERDLGKEMDSTLSNLVDVLTDAQDNNRLIDPSEIEDLLKDGINHLKNHRNRLI